MDEGWQEFLLLDKCVQRIRELSKRCECFEQALNKIAIIGSSELAYTADFTNDVNNIVRAALGEK